MRKRNRARQVMRKDHLKYNILTRYNDTQTIDLIVIIYVIK